MTAIPSAQTSPLPPGTESFDPANSEAWEALRALGHRMLDDMLDIQSSLTHRPAWQELPATKRHLFDEPAPIEGIGADAAYDRFRSHILPYGNGNWHPRFFGWVQGQGTPLAMLAEMLAAGMNPHLAGFNHSPPMVERQVVSWLAQLMGIPGAGGLLVTGGTAANTHALGVARFAAVRARGGNVREHGLQHWPEGPTAKPLVFYGSVETHGWARKAAEWLGLGDRAFRRVPVDAAYEMDLVALRGMIERDRQNGLDPFCVMGTAGTVNTGATDALPAIAQLCRDESLWFHVDGAFGALAVLAPSVRDQMAGLELADSIAFDLHKWGAMPFECACVLVRDPAVNHDTFRANASYLAETSRGVSAGGVYFADRGLDLTRGFKALKVWMQLQASGVAKLGRIIEQNVTQAQHFARAVLAHPSLELLAPAPLNIVCFRYRADALDDDTLNVMNEELLLRLQERGIAVPSSTRIGGRFALRLAHVNHRTTDEDMALVLAAVTEIGDELVGELVAARAQRGP
ncbi:pyridoxal phosphate-dependent decarboxylase family protein [Gemmatimonas groenlandica]|uniref:Amino acid decarboxylase n=1 Tax=Gemmatimonas groenlandica TaxID=2732249 RepID=A0A6M4IIB7_9BACT|nr:pyridoxal-dependent decarboxylase [Gemmatimonas groenlandica]QJR34834.1 amino acid decarboxylase [Gemmatimonas groenlandica]